MTFAARWLLLLTIAAFPLSAAPKKAPPKPAPKKATPAKKKPPAKAVIAKPVKPPLPPPPDPALAKFSTINSLGMRFVRVGEIEFSIWPVRVRDYAACPAPENLDEAWRAPGFAQSPDHPVVKIQWRDAVKFCARLTAAEHASGKLSADREYRLPTDAEWSTAAGLATETGATPEERDLGDATHFPWGTAWPPPPGAGNFSGEETAEPMAIAGYRDGFIHTSPVGEFAANENGIHDLAGNILQWCRDPWADKPAERVLRGSSWHSGALRVSLLTSSRVRARADLTSETVGFRVVIAPIRKSAPVTPADKATAPGD